MKNCDEGDALLITDCDDDQVVLMRMSDGNFYTVAQTRGYTIGEVWTMEELIEHEEDFEATAFPIKELNVSVEL
jgi:hypothetical protein